MCMGLAFPSLKSGFPNHGLVVTNLTGGPRRSLFMVDNSVVVVLSDTAPHVFLPHGRESG